jgi:putative addiction module component (TIGR02574 family)
MKHPRTADSALRQNFLRQLQKRLRRVSVQNFRMSIYQIASAALRLPARDRALLAGSLWESLGDPSATTAPIDDAAVLALSIERDEQMEAGQVQAIPYEEMMARLRQ